jgi:hypothetical protein
MCTLTKTYSLYIRIMACNGGLTSCVSTIDSASVFTESSECYLCTCFTSHQVLATVPLLVYMCMMYIAYWHLLELELKVNPWCYVQTVVCTIRSTMAAGLLKQCYTVMF